MPNINAMTRRLPLRSAAPTNVFCAMSVKPVLPPIAPGITLEQLVLVDQHLVAGLGGKNGGGLCGDLREHRVGHRCAEDDREVVRRGPHVDAGPVEAGRGAGIGAVCAEQRCLAVHLHHGDVAGRRAWWPACWRRRCPTPAAAPRAAGGRCRPCPAPHRRNCIRPWCRLRWPRSWCRAGARREPSTRAGP